MPFLRMDNISETVDQIEPQIRVSGTKNCEMSNPNVTQKRVQCKWNPAISIHDKPLLGITYNNHLKLACLYSMDGLCFFLDQNLQAVTKLSTQFIIKHALLLDTHLILCNSNGANYDIVSISLLTNQQSSIISTSSMVIGLFAIDAYYKGFVMIDANGKITFFAPENDRWRVDCIRSLGSSVNCCDVRDNRIYCCSKDNGINVIQILDIRTGAQSNIKTKYSSIFYLCPVEYKDELALFIATNEGENALYSIPSGLLLGDHHEGLTYENACVCRVPGKGYIAIQCNKKYSNRGFSLMYIPQLTRYHFGYALKHPAMCLCDISDFVGRPCCALLRNTGLMVTFILKWIVF